MIKTVFLDVDNTLLDFDECSRQSMKLAFQDFHLDYHESMFDVFCQINELLWQQIEKGQLDKEGLYQVRWQMIFQELKIDCDSIKFEKDFLKYLGEISIPIDGAMELLQYLSSRYTLCIVSNAPYFQQIKRLQKIHLLTYIDHIFISEQIGFSKPSCEFFDACFMQLPSLKKEETIIIGDSLSADIKGGINYGISTCWYNHKHQLEPCDLKIDYIVETLLEIKNIL